MNPTILCSMSQLEVLTDVVEKDKDLEELDTRRVPVRSADSAPEPRSVSEKLRKAFYAFSEWCNRLDMDNRGL